MNALHVQLQRAVAWVLLAVFLAHPARAAVFIVTDAGDAGDGTCDATCTLRDAVDNAAVNGETDVIVVPAAFSITLLSDLSFNDPDGGSVIQGNGCTVNLNPTSVTFVLDGNNNQVQDIVFTGGTSGNSDFVMRGSGTQLLNSTLTLAGLFSFDNPVNSDVLNTSITFTSGGFVSCQGCSGLRFLGGSINGNAGGFLIDGASSDVQVGGCGAGESTSIDSTTVALIFNGTTGSNSVECSNITGQTGSVSVVGSGDILLDQNTLTAAGGAQSVLVATYTGAATLSGNTIDGATIGLDVFMSSGDVDVLGNTFTGSSTGARAFFSDDTEFSGNIFDGTLFTGLTVEASSSMVTGNTINAGSFGITLVHDLGADTSPAGFADDTPANPTITGNTVTTPGTGIFGLDGVPTNITTLFADNALSSPLAIDLRLRIVVFTHDETGAALGNVDVDLEDAIGMTLFSQTTNGQGFTDLVMDYLSSNYSSQWGEFQNPVLASGSTFAVCPFMLTATSGTFQGTAQVCPDGLGGGVPPQGSSSIPPFITIGGSTIYTVVNVELVDTSNLPPTVDIENAASPKPRVNQGETFVLDTFIQDQEDTQLSQIGVTIESDQEGVLFTGTADGSTARRPFWARLLDSIAPNLLVSTTLSQPLTLTTLGDHVVTVTATDADGASASDTLLLQVIDPGNAGCSSSPTFTITSPENGAIFDVEENPITVLVDVDDPDLPSDSLSVSLSSDINGGLGAQGGLGAGTVSFGVSLTRGLHALTATVSDSCPNAVNGSIFVTVVDGDADCDGDGTPDSEEPDQDGDGVPDDCDPCPQGDQDFDGVCDSPTAPVCMPGEDEGCTDSCPSIPNRGQEDQDGDGVGDACDNCPDAHNAGQADDDEDGVGNLCDDGTTSPPPPAGACNGEACTVGDLVCVLQGTCDPPEEPIGYGDDPIYMLWFEKAASNLAIEFQNSDPEALNTLLEILTETNRERDIPNLLDRDRIREIIDDLMSQFWPGQRPLVGDLLALERETGARDLGAPPASNDPDNGGCEYFDGCGSVGGYPVPSAVAFLVPLAWLRLQRRLLGRERLRA